MRPVIIDNLEYLEYEAIRDILIMNIPFAIINDMYSKKTKRAVFYFWDSDYIPKELEQFILKPPKSHEDIPKFRKDLAEIIKKIKK